MGGRGRRGIPTFESNVVNTPATNVTIIFATKESQGNYMMGGRGRGVGGGGRGAWEGHGGRGLLHPGS